jgi:hypothetical protein
MAGRVRNLLNRDGRYFARLVIPKELRPFMAGKTELRTALGPDYRSALKMLPGAVALLQHEISLGERRAMQAGAQAVTVGRFRSRPNRSLPGTVNPGLPSMTPPGTIIAMPA